MTITDNAGESLTIQGNISLSVPGLLLGVIPTKQIQRWPKLIGLQLPSVSVMSQG